MDEDKASKVKGLAWVLAAVLLAVTLALGISPLVRAIPWSWEKKMSHLSVSTTFIEVCRDNPKTEALLKQLINRLYPLDSDDSRFSLHIQMIKDPTVNAFAELGGKISINSGLLEQAESADEIAGVLAHEIEHVRRRHILEGFIVHLMTLEGIKFILGSASSTQWTNYFLHMGFSRSQEADADQGALRRLQQARIDNHGFNNFFERMKDSAAVPAFVSDHPSNQTRSEMTGKFQNQNTQPVMTGEEWKIFKTYCQ